MNVADLIPAGRRMPRGEGEPTAPVAAEPANGVPQRAQPEDSFADILAGPVPAAAPPAVAVQVPEVLPADSLAAGPATDADTPPELVAMAVPADVELEQLPISAEPDPAVAPLPIPDPDASRLAASEVAEPPLARPSASAEAQAKAAATAPTAPVAASPMVPPPESVRLKAAAGAGDDTPSDVPRADVPEPEAKDRQPSTQSLAAPPSQAGDPRLATSTPPAFPPAGPVTIVPLEAAAGPGWRLEADAPGAATARSDAPPPAAGRQPVAQQITAAVARASDGQVEIRLDPPELGRVQIRMETTDDGVRAVVLAERPETQDLLRRNADQLTRDLGAAGFERVSLDFSAGGQAAARRDRAALQFAAAGQGVSAETPPPDAARPRLSAAGGLDIRL